MALIVTSSCEDEPDLSAPERGLLNPESPGSLDAKSRKKKRMLCVLSLRRTLESHLVHEDAPRQTHKPS